MNTKRTKSTTPPAKIAEDNTKQGEKIKRFVRHDPGENKPNDEPWYFGLQRGLSDRLDRLKQLLLVGFRDFAPLNGKLWDSPGIPP